MHALANWTAQILFGMLACATGASAQTYSADVPDSLLTPDVVETAQLGTLRFSGGLPDDETVRKVYDNIDFARGIEAFLSGMPAASLNAMCTGFEAAGVPAHTVGISEELLDARSLWLTANSTTVYVTSCLDLSRGAVVVEAPPGLLGLVNDAFFRWVTDIGVTGPDQGRAAGICSCPRITTARSPRSVFTWYAQRPTCTGSSPAPSWSTAISLPRSRASGTR